MKLILKIKLNERYTISVYLKVTVFSEYLI